jgi:uncharacterized protein (DUF488 family)
LVAITKAFGGAVNSVDFQKYLFLYTSNYEQRKSYEFIPYNFGCFSFQSYADKRKLIALGLLEDTNDWRLTNTGASEKSDAGIDMLSINKFSKKYKEITGNDLIKLVYRLYPYYASRSKIAQQIMSPEEFEKILSHRSSETDKVLFTIGYEGSSIDNFLNRLIRNDVKVLCDVRRNPVSRKYGFSKQVLSQTLQKIGIEYVHMPELGISSDHRQKLTSHEAYRILFHEYDKSILGEEAQSLGALENLLDFKERVAITCFEAEHVKCHRSRIAIAIKSRSENQYRVAHI